MSTKTILSIIIVLLVCGAGYLAVSNLNNAPDETVSCTQEALLCPDGSGVGRMGPKCEFSACPKQESFTGELLQSGRDFRLVIAAPEGVPGATYALPLHIRVSNVLGQLVGKTVVVRGVFSTGNTLVVETLEEATAEQTTEKATLSVGETGFLNGVKITLNAVSQDSRCPVDVTCVWAGRVTANVTLVSDTDTETLDLSSDGAPHPFDSFQVSIKSVSPAPKSTEVITDGAYRITFDVGRLPQ